MEERTNMPSVNETGEQPKRRAVTAESMAAKQRDISVSEFFAKNRHLLGFDNPRKALLTAVKEAVDNSLDACEEAGIVPEIWVHIEAAGPNRYKVGVQDNGPGIVKKQIPLIFGKLLYGSKFHRLRMSRGQQGIGISAAGMYGMLTTGKPVKIVSMTSPKKPAHYFEIQIDTRRNMPEIINGKGDGEDIPAGEKGQKYITDHGIEWVSHYPVADQESHHHHGVRSGTRVTIELEGRYQRGRGSVDEYLEQTAIANPHVTIHYVDPESGETTYSRSTTQLPREPVEIKPHPYGIELGQLVTMLKDTSASSMAQFLTTSFSRVSSGVAQKLCEAAKISTRANPKKIGRHEADLLYKAIQETKISAPATDCISPIGESLILKGLHQQLPGEFFCAATRPPAVYRGNPFLIEVGLGLRRRQFNPEGHAGRIDRTAKRERRPLAEAILTDDVRWSRRDWRREDPVAGEDGNSSIAFKAEEGGNRSTLRRNEKCQPERKPVDAGPALREPCSASVPAGSLRHHAVGHRHQLAGLRLGSIARSVAGRSGHGDGACGQRVGAVYQ